MEILRGMEVKITGVIHRLIFLKKKLFIFFFFFFWGGGIFVQIIGEAGGQGPPRALLFLRPWNHRLRTDRNRCHWVGVEVGGGIHILLANSLS